MAPEVKSWWRSSVIYQIYVRSFYDTDGDGIGNIAGITAKLDYLKWLGVTAIWLSPTGPSANHDWGYDTTNYYGVDPSLGTTQDLEQLLTQAKAKGIRVILDLVPNHTSIEHPWFQSACRSKTDPYRDWYIWADEKRGGGRPNNWKSCFGGSAWRYHKPTGQYFLHNFLPQQADLNWRNPAVQAEFKHIIGYWFDRGVAGFRIDVVNMLSKDKHLRDNPPAVHADTLGIRLLGQQQTYSGNGSEVHEILKSWRQKADSYREPRLLLGEVMVYQPKELAEYYGRNDELQLGFNFPFWLSKLSARSLRRIVAETEAALPDDSWPVWAVSNHDISRAASRWAKGDQAKIRLILLMQFGLRGTPVLYYGEEIGLTDTMVPRWRYQDTFGKTFWPLYGGRDRARTPMVWDSSKGVGFTQSNIKTWLPIGSRRRNVADQKQDPSSVLNFTKRLIALRAQTADLLEGSYHELSSADHVWAWQRGKATIVVLNMSGRHVEFHSQSARIIFSTGLNTAITGKVWSLGPWQGLVLAIEPAER